MGLGKLLLKKEFTQQTLVKLCSITQAICDTIHQIELENNTYTLSRYLNTPQLKMLLQLLKQHLEWSHTKIKTYVTYIKEKVDLPNAPSKDTKEEDENTDSGHGSVFSNDSDDLLADKSMEESMEESSSETGSLNSLPIGGERKSKKRLSFFSKKKPKENN